ncbi:MAG: hypothetical protein GF365_04310 [Candidatus Buchananbacteria bacterium]|nr:hypothetical protein [Candidatus Buchananbacteria bacterium]
MKSKNFINNKIFLITGIILLSYIFLFTSNLKAASPTKQAELTLQVPLLGYTKASGIAEYIGKIYEASLYIIVPIVIVIIIFAGIKWIFAGGDVSKIKEAKKYITSAFIGLTIALLSYVILSFIGITELGTPEIKHIEEIESPDIFSAPPTGFNVSAPGVIPGDIYCPKSGGAASMEKIAKSAVGRVTYRMGGKIWNGPPYTADSKDCGVAPCKSFCPTGTVCLDCSGFVSFVYKCGGLKGPPSYTGSMFGCNCSKSEKINNVGPNSINGKTLVPGDFVGYPSGCKHGVGHVYIYVGGGTIFESHGGGGTSNPNSGRHPGKAILGTPFNSHRWVGAGKPKCVVRINP